jgi:hypothetical protein
MGAQRIDQYVSGPSASPSRRAIASAMRREAKYWFSA